VRPTLSRLFIFLHPKFFKADTTAFAGKVPNLIFVIKAAESLDTNQLFRRQSALP
jgi:hypothetical protein